ncbi:MULTISPECIES: hypothetical protein [Streptomyces]|uniref:Uncharacterized protein n=1 Tax=Streptomyces bangladeshensis TaxID=295352 RepID=A0ABN3B8V8_9ACTN|nr:hypothetical protein [Streptomyces sp. EAS-AB2608]BCM67768.1 hypothetical protein EASAB2608_03102 [Streptomyces sp. EAS-AB2608]
MREASEVVLQIAFLIEGQGTGHTAGIAVSASVTGLVLRPLGIPPAGHDVPRDRGQGQLTILVNDKPTLAQERLQRWADLFAQFLRQVVIREGETILYPARHVEHDGFLPRGDGSP